MGLGCRLRWGGCRRLWEARPVWLKALLGRGPAGIRGTGAARSAASWLSAPVRPLGSDPSPGSWPRVSQETPAPGEGPCALGSSRGELSRPRLPGKRGRT